MQEETENESQWEKTISPTHLQCLYQFCISFLFFILAVVLHVWSSDQAPTADSAPLYRWLSPPAVCTALLELTEWLGTLAGIQISACLLCIHFSWALQLWGRSRGSGCCPPSLCNHKHRLALIYFKHTHIQSPTRFFIIHFQLRCASSIITYWLHTSLDHH